MWKPGEETKTGSFKASFPKEHEKERGDRGRRRRKREAAREEVGSKLIEVTEQLGMTCFTKQG